MGNMTECDGLNAPFGYTYDEKTGLFRFCVACACRKLALLLFADGKLSERFWFPEDLRRGNVFSMGLKLTCTGPRYSYAYEADGIAFSDPYGRVLIGRDKWGEAENIPSPVLRTVLTETGFSLADGDASPEPFSKGKMQENVRNVCDRQAKSNPSGEVIYRLNVHSFTRDPSSAVAPEKRGTFDGVIEKIPYLRDLGITTVELMPVYEFNERVVRNGAAAVGSGMPQPGAEAISPPSAWVIAAGAETQTRTAVGINRIVSGKSAGTAPKRHTRAKLANVWGFTPDAQRFAVKASLGGRGGYFRLLDALHQNGISLVCDLYFDGTESLSYMTDVLRTWSYEYCADGIHIIGSAPLRELARDPYLAGRRIWCDAVPGDFHAGSAGKGIPEFRLQAYNNAFQNDMRRFLKGDAGMLFTAHQRLTGDSSCEETGAGPAIHYMANADGFTLWDTFSYQEKHNELNGERNRDGTDENFSWNCGEEGASRKRAVRALRLRLYKNAILLNFLSCGTPLLFAGDEFGRTQRGNNNGWCQDNPTGWLDWSFAVKNAPLLDFVRFVIRIRGEHPVLRYAAPSKKTHARPIGNGGTGNVLPPLSVHGKEVWRIDYAPEARQLGVCFCGAYAERTNGSRDDDFYLACNFYWESQAFALPTPSQGREWCSLIDTERDDPAEQGVPDENQAEVLFNQKELRVGPRSMVLLIARPHARKGK